MAMQVGGDGGGQPEGVARTLQGRAAQEEPLTLRVDPQGGPGVAYRTLHEAVRLAPAGSTLLLAPVSHDIEGRMLSINKSLHLRGELSPGGVAIAEITGMPTSVDEMSMIFVRNQEVDVDFSLRDLTIRAGRLPDSVRDRGLDCLRVQGGRRGVRTNIVCERVTFTMGSGGVGIEHYIFGDNPSDSDFTVTLRDCTIADIFDDRLANGVKEDGNAQGVYHDGGTLLMERVAMRRVGWIPDSPVYMMSNKNQGLYAVRGVRRIINCVAEDVSHCGFAYRAGTTYSEGNVSIRTPMGFQAGHRQTPGLAVVLSVNDRVLDGQSFPDVSDGNPTITCGFHIDDAQYVSITGFVASNVTGQGGWGGLHLSRVQSTWVDVRGATIENWPGGGFRTSAALDSQKHRFERVRVVRDNPSMPGFVAPELSEEGIPRSGTFINCRDEVRVRSLVGGGLK